MISFEFCKFYFSTNLGIAMTGVLAWIICQNRDRLADVVEAKWLLRSIYFCIISSVSAPLLFLALPQSKVWQPMTQVWSGMSAKDVSPNELNNPSASYLILSFGDAPLSPYSSLWFTLCVGLMILGTSLALVYLVLNLVRLRAIVRDSLSLRQIGKVRVIVVQRNTAPFSFSYFGKAMIAIPEMLIQEPENLSISIRHEIQHHRQLDHWFSWPLLILRAFCWWNPLFALLQEYLNEIQEMACDEAVIGRRTSAHTYGRCLLWVARMTSSAEQNPVGTTGFAGGTAAHKLRRRIESMFKRKGTCTSKMSGIGLCTAAGAAIWLGLATASASIQDRRIDMDEARELASRAGSEEFPIAMNDLVLRELNRYLGTPDGRKFITDGITRMADFEPMIQEHLQNYKMPSQLLAVPLIESGYQNLAPNGKAGYGAGLWMFIAPTARRYGLKVGNGVDERLDTRLETDAAMRYLSAAKLQFKDWELALLTYNAGEGAVSKGIAQHQTRDAWQLIRAGVENDPNYLAKIMAAAIILANREVLK
jgi:membrane-bound lytic murein transglycosylase D